MYSLPSTSRSTQPSPESNVTGKSFTCPLRPLKYFVQRSCHALDCGPGAGTTMFGYLLMSVFPHSRVLNALFLFMGVWFVV